MALRHSLVEPINLEKTMKALGTTLLFTIRRPPATHLHSVPVNMHSTMETLILSALSAENLGIPFADS